MFLRCRFCWSRSKNFPRCGSWFELIIGRMQHSRLRKVAQKNFRERANDRFNHKNGGVICARKKGRFGDIRKKIFRETKIF
jgi:hypothetical protein